MLDEMCEAAKQEMRDLKESELGLWQNAIMVADGTWQTCGWHSKTCHINIYNKKLPEQCSLQLYIIREQEY